MFRKLALIGLTAIPTTTFAQDSTLVRQRFDIPVLPITSTTFEVIEADGAGGSQLWCAAGKYALEVLGVDRGDLTVLEPRGPSRTVAGRKGVVFTTEPQSNTTSSFSLSVRRAGVTFSVGHAYAVCPRRNQVRIKSRV